MSIDDSFTLSANGDAAVDIRFAAPPSAQLSETLIALAASIENIENSDIAPVTEAVPAYQCLTVCFDPLRLTDTAELYETLKTLTKNILSGARPCSGARSLIRIPVCYDEAFAPDMPALIAHTGLPREDIVARHTAPHYLVHMLGFTPGFLYLGGLDRQLHCPRKARPELNVPAGSVGIGGGQTGIYPQATPGGWQILGRTPLALFRPDQEQPFIARPLDQVQFVPISAQQFAQIDPLSAPEKTPLTSPPSKEALR